MSGDDPSPAEPDSRKDSLFQHGVDCQAPYLQTPRDLRNGHTTALPSLGHRWAFWLGMAGGVGHRISALAPPSHRVAQIGRYHLAFPAHRSDESTCADSAKGETKPYEQRRIQHSRDRRAT